MAGGSHAESVVGTPEVIDGGEPIPPNIQHGDFAPMPALSARVATMADFPGLGPPDLVYVRKRYRPVVGQPKIYGYYHFIRGADVSSPAALSAYIYRMLNVGLDPAPWLSSGSWEIIGASIHSYNAMAARDAVVDISLPGGIVASSVGPSGDVMPAVGAASDGSDAFWKEAHVCAVARAVSGVGETPLYPCMRAVPPLPNPESENDFLAIALSCVKRWHLSGTDRPSIEIATAANSRIAVAIFDYFMADARYSRAQAFFDSDHILMADPEGGALAALAAVRGGDLEAADRIISTVLELKPNAAQAHIARSNMLLAQGDLNGAIESAREATKCQPDDLVAWIALANLYVETKDYDSALVALNSAEMPPPPLDPYLRQLVPNRRKLTAPEKGGDVARSGAVRTLATRLREERNSAPGKADELLAELPGKLMTKTERDVYSILVKIVGDIGWDNLLAVRGRCFVMESDVSQMSSQSQTVGEGTVESGLRAQVGTDVDGPIDSGGPSTESVGTTLDGAGASSATRNPTAVGDVAIDIADIANATTVLNINGNANGNGAESSQPSKDDTVNGIGQQKAGAAKVEGEEDDDEDDDDEDDDGEDEILPAYSQRALEDIGKNVCKPWLDYLVTNMYEDLRAMAVWTAEEQMHRKASAAASNAASPGQAAAAALRVGGDIEEADEAIVPVRTADEIAETTRRPPVDWLRRGDLALRLKNMEEAETAFLVCSKLSEKAKTPAISALINLMNLSADEGQSAKTMRYADAIWTYVDVATERQASHKTLDAHSEPALVIRNAMHLLISKTGLSRVRNSMPSRMDINYSRMEGLLLDAVAWKVKGYDL